MLQGIIQFFANIRGLVTLASKKNIEKDLKVLRKKEVKQLSEHFARITLYHSHSWKWQACIYIQKESFFAFKYIEYGNNALKKTRKYAWTVSSFSCGHLLSRKFTTWCEVYLTEVRTWWWKWWWRCSRWQAGGRRWRSAGQSGKEWLVADRALRPTRTLPASPQSDPRCRRASWCCLKVASCYTIEPQRTLPCWNGSYAPSFNSEITIISTVITQNFICF